MDHLIGYEILEQRFGNMPSFHDAEVQAVRLDSGQRTDARPSVELDIHLFDADGLLPNGQVNWVLHTLTTLRFEGTETIELDGFGPQNVLFDLQITDLGNRAPAAACLLVLLSSSNGLGGSFRCERATVIAVGDFEPGVHSVYGKQQG
jgi:hypothetical protein